MRILLVSSFLPYPLFSGGHIRLYNLMKNLKKDGYKITLICEKRDYQGKADIEKALEVCDKVITFDRQKPWSVGNVIKDLILFRSLLSVSHNIPEMKEAIKKELDSQKYDLIHVETFYVNQNLPKVKIPVVLAEHNIEYLVYKRYADNARFPLRPLLFLDVIKVKKEEKYFWKKASRLIAVSPQDQKMMGREDVVIVANGVDIGKFDLERKKKNPNDERLVLFIGDFKWVQNRDSVSWIIEKVWPQVLNYAKRRNIKVKLWIVGKRIPQNLKDLKSDAVIFDENASTQTEIIYNKADLLLAPIRIGGGTSFKILESMASGLPVLTTALGNEGIDGKPGLDIVIEEEPSGYADSLIDLLLNPKKYEMISENGRKHVRENFDWENITKKLEQVYKASSK